MKTIQKTAPTTNKLNEWACSRSFRVLSVILLFLVLITAFIKHQINGDTFMALAGGRDIFHGQLGAPDTWSISTHGNIWINQSWGTDWFFYLMYLRMGYNGLLVIKTLFMILLAGFVYFALRNRAINNHLSIVGTAYCLMMTSYYIDIRPNSITLIMSALVLWLIAKIKKNTNYIWLFMIVLWLWSNLHGGFVFGLGIFGLYLAAAYFESRLAHRKLPKTDLLKLGSCFVLTVLFTIFANPYGFKNFSLTLMMFQKSLWNTKITEWQPAWLDLNYGHKWHLLHLVAIIIILSVFYWWFSRRNRKHTPVRKKAAPVTASNQTIWGQNTFDILIAMIAVIMAITSRRFIPLAIIMCTPVLALLIQKIMIIANKQWLLIIGALSILVYTGYLFQYNLRTYTKIDPIYNPGTFFEKMNQVKMGFPVEIADFINQNGITTPVFCNWDWEGFIHWNCPRLKVFAGGRAQQIYTEQVFQQYLDVIADPQPESLLEQLNLHLLLICNDTEMASLLDKLQSGERWVIIAATGRTFLIADSQWPETKALITNALKGRLIFPDRFTRRLSQAALSLSTIVNKNPEATFNMFYNAIKERPNAWGCFAMIEAVFDKPDLFAKYNDLLEDELAKLNTANIYNTYGEDILNSRMILSGALKMYYNQHQLFEQERKAFTSYEQANKLYRSVIRYW